MGLLREQYTELEKGHLLYCCNQVWTKIGGRIPWNVTATCWIFRTDCLMRKHYMRGDVVIPIIPFGSLVEYHPISTKDQSRTHQFWKNVLLGIFFGYVLYAGESGKKTYWWWTLMSWKRRMHRKSMLKDSTRKRWYCLIVVKFTDSQSQMEQWYLMEETKHCECHFVTQPIRGENHQGFFGESERSSPTTHFQMLAKHDMISGSFRETSHAAITLNQESKSTRRKKNHFLLHWNLLTSPGSLIQPWMCNKKTASMTTGTLMNQETCLIHGQGTHNSPLKDTRGPGGDERTASHIQAWSFVARILEKYVKKIENEGKWNFGARKYRKNSKVFFHRSWR